MRLLAISGNLDYSGSSLALYRFLKQIMAADASAAHQITVLWGRLGPPALKDAYTALGIPVVLDAAPDAYDVVLCNSILTGPLVQRCAPRCPVVWWIHEPRFGADMVRKNPALSSAFTAASRIVFPTRWQATDVYSEWLEQANWTVVENGVAVDTRPQPRPNDLPPERFTILQVGAVEWRKGADVTLQAVRRLADPRVQLIYVGPRHPNFMPALTEEEASRVRFVGAKPEAEVAAYLQHCDVLSCPTRDDLVNLAILEALQSGLPVAASRFGAIPDTIRHGWNGLLSAVDDADGLATNLARLRDEPELGRQLAANGRLTYQDRHTAAQHCDSLLGILRDISMMGHR